MIGKMGVSEKNGGCFPNFPTPQGADHFYVGKTPWVVGETHHFRKLPDVGSRRPFFLLMKWLTSMASFSGGGLVGEFLPLVGVKKVGFSHTWRIYMCTRLTCVIICFKTLEWQDNRPNGWVDVDSPACAKDLGRV